MLDAEPSDTFGARLNRLAARLPGGPTMRRFSRLSAGASQETWVIDVDYLGQPARVVLRRAPGGTQQRAMAAGLVIESQLIEIARRAGIKAPAVLHVLEASDHLGLGFVTEFIAGETLPRRIFREPRLAAAVNNIATQAGEALARIHAIPLALLPLDHAMTAEKRLAAFGRGFDLRERDCS